MIIFLHGEDEFLVSQRKQALARAFAKKYPAAEQFVFDFEDQGMLADVRRALEACAGGLFAVEKLVVFLHPYALGEAAEKALGDFLKSEVKLLPEKVILLFVHVGKVKKTDSLTKLLLAKGDKEEQIATLEGRALTTFVNKELNAFNSQVQFAPEALTLFLERTKGNTARMMSELEKLATFKEAGVLERVDVEGLLFAPTENNIFEALDAMGRGERERALLLFRREGDRSQGVYPIFGMCAWQVRRLLLVRDAFDQGIRRGSDIVSATKLPPFTVQKALAVIEHFSVSRLKHGLTLLSDIDTALKQGKADPEVSLDLFVWKF